MNTIARIVCVCQNGETHATVEANRSAMLAHAERALAHRPDLICLPEAFTSTGVPGDAAASAEPLPGPTTDAFGKLARAGRCYVLCPIHTAHGKRIHNSAVIIGRDGSIVGVYHKHCPVTTSADYTVFENGITPGDDIPVFDLDFGRVGVQICYDIGFPENWQALADKGARMVIWTSAYDGGFPLQAYAYLHHYWVVTSTRTQRSRIVDPCGEIVAETKPPESLVARPVNLDFVVSHLDWNMSIPKRIVEKYGDRVAVRQWVPGSSHFIVEPLDPSVRTEELQKEFGFESTALYHERHRRAYPAVRAGKRPAPQRALHGNRPQWGP
jgi:predicted amidohydrolase